MNEQKKYKPVIFIDGKSNYYRKNDFAQTILLKALTDGISDVSTLKKIAGVKTATELYRTLDKLSIRKEYHKALTDAGIDLPYIVNGLKNICDNSKTENIKLKSFQTLLKSIGLEKYEDVEDSAKGWEDLLIQEAEKKQLPGSIPETIEAEYKVTVPETPEEEKKKREEDEAIGKSLYE